MILSRSSNGIAIQLPKKKPYSVLTADHSTKYDLSESFHFCHQPPNTYLCTSNKTESFTVIFFTSLKSTEFELQKLKKTECLHPRFRNIHWQSE